VQQLEILQKPNTQFIWSTPSEVLSEVEKAALPTEVRWLRAAAIDGGSRGMALSICRTLEFP